MFSLPRIVTALCALAGVVAARRSSSQDLAQRRQLAAEKFEPRFDSRSKGPGVKNITFHNPKAAEYYVHGKSLPDVHWDIGPSWSGLIPISGNANETRKLFFWFFPPGPEGSLDDLIFWTNGGPGCSSLEGLLQENGPFSWAYGQAHPTVNQYSWTNLSSLLYVEQPVGVGFSQGKPNIKDEDDLAAQLVGFFQQFLEIFSELKGNKFYLTGESYAGMYVPYIANYIYEHPGSVDLDLKGIWIADPVIGWDVVQSEIPAVAFVHKYEHTFGFNQSFMAQLDATAEKCNYTDYMDKYVTYPPKGLLPLPGGGVEATDECDVWDLIFNAAVTINPAFNEYRIFDMYPILWDVLGFPGSFPQQQSPLYFNRTAVKKAIHAPLHVDWEECANENVFPKGDNSLPPTMSVLPNVLEKSERSVIIHGLADFVLIADGARIAIQNMTWAGYQGFQTPIAADSFQIPGIGAYGTSHVERGLAYYEVQLSGHMVPQFAPWAGVQSMQYLMGFRDSP